MLMSKVCFEAKGSKKQMGLGSRVFQGAKYSRKKSVPGCKVCYGAKGAEKQIVLRSQGF